MCFAACLRWFVTCKANSLVGVIISARKGFFALSLINDSFFSSVMGASFTGSLSWLDFLFRMWVRSGIPNARVLPDPWEIKNTLWKARKGTKQDWQTSSSLWFKNEGSHSFELLWWWQLFTWHQSYLIQDSLIMGLCLKWMKAASMGRWNTKICIGNHMIFLVGIKYNKHK